MKENHETHIVLLPVGTDFQKKVWNELLKIPYGKTVSYGELARRIGVPKAVRAVAAANGANAVSIFIPCHRVIGGDGSLTGYAGGLAVKKLLLDLERKISCLCKAIEFNIMKVHIFHTGEVHVSPYLSFGGDDCGLLKASGITTPKKDWLWLPVSGPAASNPSPTTTLMSNLIS